MLGRLGMETLCQLLWLAKAQHPAEKSGRWRGWEAEAQSAQQSGVCCRADQLAVNGKKNLLAAGVAPGPAVGRILQALLEQVIQGSLTNKKDESAGRGASAAAGTEGDKIKMEMNIPVPGSCLGSRPSSGCARPGSSCLA